MTDLLPYQLLPAAWIVGWTLVHFIWQAALVAAVASFALACVERRGAQARYLVCALSLAAMAAAPVITLYVLATARVVDVPSLALTALVIAPDLRSRLALLVPGFTLVWVAGVWVMQVRIAAQFIGARGLARNGTSPLSEPLRATVRCLCSQLGMRRAVQALQSTRAAVPMVVGWLRPVVLVPTAALTGLSTAQLRAVLAHELAHIKRHDALVNLLQSVFESLFFFHPAVWWLSNRLRVEREFCCDDIAVATCGDPLTYAKALAALDDARSARPAAVLAATGGSLMQRITRLLDAGRPVRRIRGWLAPMIMTLSLTAVVSAMSFTVDDEPDAKVALKGVDLVKVVGKVDGELAEILGILRTGGMDDAMLLDFVTRLGTSPEVLDAIQGATEHAARYAKMRAIEVRVSEGHGQIKADVAEGLITKQEAKLRLEALHREAKAMAAEAGLHTAHGGVDVIRHGTGDGTVIELHRNKLHKIERAHRGRLVDARVVLVDTEKKISDLQAKLRLIEKDFAAGRKSATEVEPTVQKIRKHIQELESNALQQHIIVREAGAPSADEGGIHVERIPHGEWQVLRDGKVKPSDYTLHLIESDGDGNDWVPGPASESTPEVAVVGEWLPLRDMDQPVEPAEGEWLIVPHVAEEPQVGYLLELTPVLHESAIDALHDRLSPDADEDGPTSGRLIEIMTVLSEMRAVRETFAKARLDLIEPVELIMEVGAEPVEAIVELKALGYVEAPMAEVEIEEVPAQDG